MKLQTILLLTGIAAGLMTVSCQSTSDEAEAFYGTTYPKVKKVTAEDEAAARDKADFYSQVNAHIDRRMNEFNEKEEARLPIFSSKEVKDEFMDLSFIKTSEQLNLLSIDFTGPKDESINVLFDRESRMFTRTIDGKTEEYTFAPFTNGVPPAIPYDAHILYAFVINFNRIAETVSIRSFEKLGKGENPAIAQQENEANSDEKGRKKDKNYVEIKPKVTYEPIEYRIDNRWCKCYDVKLKSACAPATALALYVSNEEKTLAREGERLLARVPEGSELIVLDVAGEALSSEELAARLDGWMTGGASHLTFLIGGAFGLSPAVRKAAKLRLSFSRMTFTHQMVRMLLVEQIYRAFKISKGEKYHW